MIENSEWFSKKDYSGEKTFLLWSSLSNTIPILFWSLFHILHDKNIFEIVKEETDKNFNFISLNNSKQIHFHDQFNLSK